MQSKNTVIGTIEISHAIERMIDESYKFLILISPYLKITDRLKAKLTDTFKHLDHCFFIYRKNELRTNERLWIETFANVYLIGVENLHAKIYLNDRACIITSMNFYEYSQINNYEIGVTIDKNSDKENYQKILDEVLLIAKLSESYDCISSVIESYQDFSVGKLYNKLKEITNRYSYSSFPNEAYLRFCNDARKIVQFSAKELYQDKSSILRSVNLGKDRYENIFNKLK